MSDCSSVSEMSTRCLSFHSDVSNSNNYKEELNYSIVALPFFYPDATNVNQIDKILTPHLTKEGSFILRPSQTNPGQNTISVIEDGRISNYRILKYDNKYSIYPRGPYFSSEYVLLNHYSSHSLSIPGALLKHPINYVPQFDDHH